MAVRPLTLLRIATTVYLLCLAAPAQAAPSAQTPAPLPSEPLFRLPFDSPPGPATWYVIQFFGNTQGAYIWRERWYDRGQGLHFGVDFAAPCGTPVVAIGDGEVAKIDARQHGSGPHNLVIWHPEGFVSLYGHLLETPVAYIGQPVRAGQVIGYSGDPDLNCVSRPHLHLEIRDATYGYAYNPILLIDADWDSLALFGLLSGFERDLDNPRRWVTPTDQPIVDFGGEILNDYAHPWPPDWY